MKLTHTDPQTFETSEVDVNVPEILVSVIRQAIEGMNDFSSTPVMVSEDLKDIVLGVMTRREPGGPISKKYRVTISPTEATELEARKEICVVGEEV